MSKIGVGRQGASGVVSGCCHLAAPHHPTMKLILVSVVATTFVVTLLVNAAYAADPASIATAGQPNTICPVSGKPADPAITWTYEDRTWAFAKEECRAKFQQEREGSLYHKLGGQAAISAAVDAFYVKVLKDERVKHFFDDVSMPKQHRKQKEFLNAALGGPVPWTGKDMRKAHDGMGLTEVHFNAIAENLVATLQDLKVSQELIDQVIAVVATTKDDILGRPKQAQ